MAFAAAACAGDPPPPSAAAPQVLPPCVLERRPLVLPDGSEVYVEHEQVIEVGDELLLAGVPSYAWRLRPEGGAEMLSRDVLAAAYLREPTRTVEKPIAGAPASVRVAALDEGRWAAIVLQVDPDSLPGIEIFEGLWYGEHDGERWTLVEPMEFPGGRLSSRLSTRLVRAGDRLVWLAMEHAGNSSVVHVYERAGGAWARHVVAGWDRVEQMELAYLEGSGLWVLLSGYDAGLPGFQKSLRLYRERLGPDSAGADAWELVSRVVVAESGVALRFASLVVQSSGATVTWEALGRGTSTTMARAGIGPDTPGTLLTLAESSVYARPAVMPDGSVAILVDHFEDGPPTPASRPELRLLRVAEGAIERLTTFRSPFTGSFIVRAVSDTEVLALGAELLSDPSGERVRSLILRLSTSC
jgi:hypothetical protein